jgi:hypothetical protein
MLLMGIPVEIEILSVMIVFVTRIKILKRIGIMIIRVRPN